MVCIAESSVGRVIIHEAWQVRLRSPDRHREARCDQRVRVGGESEGSFCSGVVCSGVVNLSSLDIRSRDRSITAFDSLIALRLMSMRSWKSSSTDRRLSDCGGGGCLRIFDSLCGHRRECDSCLSAASACFRSFANDEKIMRASWVKFQSEQEGNCRELGSRRITKNGFQISRDTGVQIIVCPAHSVSHERQDVHMTEQVRCISTWILPDARCPPVESTR